MIRSVFLSFFLCTGAVAKDAISSALFAVERIDLAAEMLENATEAEDRVSALTQAVLAFEDGLAATRDAARRIQLARNASQLQFDAKSQEVSRLLAAMQAAGSPTTATGLLHPSGPLGSARAAMLISEVIPTLEHEAQVTMVGLKDLLALEAAVERAAQALEIGANGAREARLALTESLRLRTEIPDAREGATALLAYAGLSLEELALVLVESPAATNLNYQAPFIDALGNLVPPVNGAVVSKYSSRSPKPGVTLATRTRALVHTPVNATVRYIGELDGYGNVMIIEPAPGYLMVLAGVHEPLVGVGQALPPGAALGLMGGTEDNLAESQNDHGRTLTETLYIETRANGDTVDPASWFALDKED